MGTSLPCLVRGAADHSVDHDIDHKPTGRGYHDVQDRGAAQGTQRAIQRRHPGDHPNRRQAKKRQNRYRHGKSSHVVSLLVIGEW